LDLTQTEALEPIIPFITNPEAIAVNQQWAGHPGRLVKQYTPAGEPGKFVAAKTCSNSSAQFGWSYDAESAAVRVGDGCLDAGNHNEMQVKNCTGSDDQKFVYNAEAKTLTATNGQCVDTYNWKGPKVCLYDCNGGTNQQVEFNDDGSVCEACHESRKMCWEVTASDPTTENTVQVWAKPQPQGAIAVLVINVGSSEETTKVDLVTLGFSKEIAKAGVFVRDIWARADAPASVHEEFATAAIPAMDSRFYLLKPTSHQVAV
jgi:hypothetical protein